MRAILFLMLVLAPTCAAAAPCDGGVVYEDRDGDRERDRGERGIAGVKVSDGVGLAVTGADGRYRLPDSEGRTVFVIRPPGYALPAGDNGLPVFWRHAGPPPGPARDSGGLPRPSVPCIGFGLRPQSGGEPELDVLVFADTQTKSMTDVGYYERDVVEPLSRAGGRADLGITLGDIVAAGNTALYPAVDRVTRRLRLPWLHVPGNHDMDFDAKHDRDALRSFHAHYGPDTYAWEDRVATLLVLDDVIYQPGAPSPYVGGIRDEQFAFLERYLPTVPRDRLLVVALHIPLFDAEPGRETFRRDDRERLFALLEPFPHVLVLSGHSHAQRHVFHGADSGWHGSRPLHEYNVGAVSGAYWSGAKDAAGIPDATMSDGTPNGHARLRVGAGGRYALEWIPARIGSDDPAVTPAMALHAPKVLRRGAYPAWGVYANVFMGRDDTRVEFRVDRGEWKPMRRVAYPDPRLLAENVRDDEAAALRGYDRSPEATPSPHLWRAALPTDLGVGTHRVDVRAFDAWQGEQRASIGYRLDDRDE